MRLLCLLFIGINCLTLPASCQESIPRLSEDLRRADAFQEEGKSKKAREIYERLLKEIPESAATEPHAHVLNGLSNTYVTDGDFGKAADFAGRAAEIYQTINDEEGEAYALNNLGIAEDELAAYSEAHEHFNRAIKLAESVADLETQVRTWNNLGNSFYFPGKYFEATRAYEQAWGILKQHPQERWCNYWSQITQINQATLYQRLGRYQVALALYKQVGTTSQNLSPSDRAQMQANLGVLYRRLGDSWKALDSYRLALKLYSQQHDAAGEINVLKNIGIVYALDQNDLHQAERYFNNALSRAKQDGSMREQMQAHLYLGETLIREQRLDDAFGEFQLALEQARALGTSEEQWKAQYELGKVWLQRDQPDKAEAQFRAAIALIEASRAELQLSALRAEFLADKRDVYDALINLLLKKNDPKEIFAVLERSRSRNFQDRIAALNGSPSSAPVPDLDEVRRSLPPSTVLLEFWTSGNRIATIWCSGVSSGLSLLDLSSDAQNQLNEFLQGLPGTLAGDWKSSLSALSRLIPQEIFSQGFKHLIVVPDNWLSSVPFDLIAAPNAPNSILLDRFDISYLPSAIFFRRKQVSEAARLHFPWERELTAYGNPTIADPKQPGVFEKSSPPKALPYSESEILSISKMTAGKSDLFLGNRDLKNNFLASIKDATPILHVSTHALTNMDVPEDSRILFSAESGNSAPEYLFLRELYDMDLHKVQLATLSACDTERGKIVRGEGAQAFSRALLHGGARASLTTLWRVQDAPTAEFMQQFYYFALKKHQPLAEAMRSAKLKFLHTRGSLQDPAHWASFVINGDGQEPLARFVSWRELIAAAILGVLIVVFAFRLLLRFRSRTNRIHRSEQFVSRES
jgi:CHAT domain-containing protein/Flp pilus assembly protein TadD